MDSSLWVSLVHTISIFLDFSWRPCKAGLDMGGASLLDSPSHLLASNMTSQKPRVSETKGPLLQRHFAARLPLRWKAPPREREIQRCSKSFHRKMVRASEKREQRTRSCHRMVWGRLPGPILCSPVLAEGRVVWKIYIARLCEAIAELKNHHHRTRRVKDILNILFPVPAVTTSIATTASYSSRLSSCKPPRQIL